MPAVLNKAGNYALICGELDIQTAGEFVRRTPSYLSMDVLLLSEGGSVGAALAIHDELKRFTNSSVTASGLCASAALLVLAAGKARFATENTVFLFHPVQFTDKAMKAWQSGVQEQVDKVISGLVGAENFEKLSSCFGAKLALELGLIQGIK